jgi:hypothetical protein
MPDPLSYAQVQWAHAGAHDQPPRRFAPRRRAVVQPNVAAAGRASELVDGELHALTTYSADAKVLSTHGEATKALLDVMA